MKRVLALALGVWLWPIAAFALTQSAVPPKFPIPWGASAGSAYIRSIPTPSQIGIQNCAASLTDGFPPLTFTPAIAGGCPPDGRDFNGVLNQLSQWGLWQAAGSPTVYDSSFQSSIGGYPKGAVISSASIVGCFWLSAIDNNSSNPETGGAGWIGYCVNTNASGASTVSTGSPNLQFISTKPFVQTVGSTVTFFAAYANTGPLLVNVNGAGFQNVYRKSQLGVTMSVGGEVHVNEMVTLVFDGTEWQCTTCKVVMVGQAIDYHGSSAPAGTLFEDGSCVSQAVYPDLYGILGTNWGSCGAGNFALPDSRSRALVARDNQGVNGAANLITTAGSNCNASVIGTRCGGQNQTLGTGNLPPYTPSATLTATIPYANGQVGTGSQITALTFQGSTTVQTSLTFNAQGGSSVPFSILQPMLVVTKVIQY